MSQPLPSTRERPKQIKAAIRYVVKGERSIFYPADRDKSYWPAEEHEMTLTSTCGCNCAVPLIEISTVVLCAEPS